MHWATSAGDEQRGLDWELRGGKETEGWRWGGGYTRGYGCGDCGVTSAAVILGGLNRWKHRKLNQTPDPAVLAVFAKGGIVLLAPLA